MNEPIGSAPNGSPIGGAPAGLTAQSVAIVGAQRALTV